MRARLFCFTMVLVLCASAGVSQAQASQAQAQDTKPQPEEKTNGPAIGTQAPDFDLPVIDSHGKTMKLSSLQGKAVIVNFWATWCDPCKIEMPWLVDLQKKYGPQGLQIVGVALDDADEKTISRFAHKMGVNYPVLIGTEKVADLYGGVEGLPISYFLDRSGKVVDHILGLVSKSQIEESIEKSLAAGGSAPASVSPQMNAEERRLMEKTGWNDFSDLR